MHPLLDQILTTGNTELPDGSTTPLTSSISREDCALVERMIAACGAVTAVEVGMAFGISTLCIADALQRNATHPPARLVTIDPHQSSGWHGAGMHLIRRAGFEGIVELIEQPSQLALPRLVEIGERFGFALIDGWHTFDHTLVDFFFADALLTPGGIVVVDDTGYPAINGVVRFILANRDYELVESVDYRDDVRFSLRARRALKRMIRPMARTDRDPSRANDRLFQRIARSEMVALRKRGDDTRRFDHFERF
jgi:predicted O-methyltransferase YrrM